MNAVRCFSNAWLCLTLLLVVGSRVFAQSADLEDDDNPFRPGLVARYFGPDGRAHERREEQVSFVWNDQSPDRRVPAGPFRATYTGLLQTQTPGIYRLRVFAAGKVSLKLAGRTLLDATSAEPGWLAAEPIELPFGFHPLEVEFQRTNEHARLALYWEGPQFGWEPIAGRWLFHKVGETPSDDFERGQQLVRALRCAACHAINGESSPIPAPALTQLKGNVDQQWLVNWLQGAPSVAEEDAEALPRRMPHFAWNTEQATVVADALLKSSAPLKLVKLSQVEPPVETKSKTKDKNGPPPPPEATAALGGTLFRSLGCLACHRVGELGRGGLFDGGDLAQVADKRPADYFARWLTEPASINSRHLMPVFALAPHERDSLSLYLQSLHAPADAKTEPPVGNAQAKNVAPAESIRQARCQACHELPVSLTVEKPVERRTLDLTRLERSGESCLDAADTAHARPGYAVSPTDRRAIQTFLAGVLAVPSAPAEATGPQRLAEHNCLACHTRGTSIGLAAVLPQVSEADETLRQALPALLPPALSGVGDKLHDAALTAAIREPRVRRPWLRVRMPRFRIEPAELKSIVGYLVDTDRMPDLPPEAKPAVPAASPEAALDAAGPRLVTADGFGCTSCHAIGKWVPQKVALNAQGTPLDELGERLRRPWFDRWVRNPARIVAQMEMPSVQQPIRGVLDEQLDAQLSAVWQVLNRPGFTPPSPSALRVARRGNLPDVHEPAAVLTDVIEIGKTNYTKPLVIGLDNRHNVLFDLETGRLAAWWIGDAARQQTRGKTWYWEAGVPQLLPQTTDASPLGDFWLLDNKRPVLPVAKGQFITELDALEHAEFGVRFSHRLHFGADVTSRVLHVEQRFAPLRAEAGQPETGFRRQVRVQGASLTKQVQLFVLPGESTIDSGGMAATIIGPQGRLHVSVVNPGLKLEKSPRGAIVTLGPNTQGGLIAVFDYRSEAVPDRFAPLPVVNRTLPRLDLPVVPGFDAVRLPTSDEAMPTGMAWREDGTLLVSSLEGRVWLARDTDGDGLEDKLTPFGDDLPAPYGLAAHGAAIDVVTKFGLVRLFDEDQNDRAERMEVVASGWGHTRDYHDWAVGLPRDRAGNYYVSLPCQQDERSPEAARLRGTMIRLSPHASSSDNPRRYTIEPLAAGLRFPQGLALSADEQLFATDNQGNYTPFNELNHIVAGARYGFINRLEQGINPPFRPAAVEIPHPWTRSVNGICFLETPAEARQQLGRDAFGPFEHHLVGCEYDTRRLVRMSLERVAGEYQGAVYPFSRQPAEGEPTFEGPLSAAVAPDGDLYIGNIRDSGWGAGANTGSFVRLKLQEPSPGIAEVTAAPRGFQIRFTSPVDRARAEQPANYSVSSFKRTPTPAYGGEDQMRRVEPIRAVRVAEDGLSILLELAELREGFVYEFHLRNLSTGALFFPDEAYYTLRHRLPEKQSRNGL